MNCYRENDIEMIGTARDPNNNYNRIVILPSYECMPAIFVASTYCRMYEVCFEGGCNRCELLWASAASNS